MPMQILLATRNEGKVREIRSLLKPEGLDVLSLADMIDLAPEVVEDGATFAENARKKAVAVARWSGLPALADDSGLLVEALGGRPGVESARYAGADGDSEANMDKLLAEMEDVPDDRRQAHFTAVIVVAAPDGRTWEAQGRVDGVITRQRQGEGGFGYDPVFFFPPAGLTFARMGREAKNAVSHRGQALAALARMMPDIRKEFEIKR